MMRGPSQIREGLKSCVVMGVGFGSLFVVS